MIPDTLQIIYESDELIAINKPHGLLVHRSRIAKDVKEFALQKLRDQIGQIVYLGHRLDRKTSGVLLFTKSSESNAIIQSLFRERKVKKKYIAIVRGFVNDCEIVYPLTVDDKVQEARTTVKLLEQYEISISLGNHKTSRYSMVELCPHTGRFHQLRKHMAHIRHPIIGDRPHGCSKQNRLWKNKFGMIKMMLHAQSLELNYSGEDIVIQANRSIEFERVLNILRDY